MSKITAVVIIPKTFLGFSYIPVFWKDGEQSRPSGTHFLTRPSSAYLYDQKRDGTGKG
jgi:hypothetical protein